ncbi:hypothetical protein AB0950_36985 [Streptomyces sp. NPDC007189]|uniref:hypothetical protein n=1 Tax=Streptomyces sp. NPDC007189 TaxID=3154315 RepID=UPI0034565302
MELWRTRHDITAVPALGPRPDDPDTAAAWDDLDARVRGLPTVPLFPLLPPDAPASAVITAALTHLDTPPPAGPLPDHSTLHDPHVAAPPSHGALHARTVLTAVLAG